MSTLSSRRTRGSALALPAVLALPLLLLAGSAQAYPLHDTTRFLVQQGKACVGAAECRPIASAPRRIKAGRVAEITAHCPEARPHFVNWDASFHEHIGVRVTERRADGVTVVATNQADATGRVTLFIGCAKDPPGPTIEIGSLGALPTRALQRAGR